MHKHHVYKYRFMLCSINARLTVIYLLQRCFQGSYFVLLCSIFKPSTITSDIEAGTYVFISGIWRQ